MSYISILDAIEYNYFWKRKVSNKKEVWSKVYFVAAGHTDKNLLGSILKMLSTISVKKLYSLLATTTGQVMYSIAFLLHG